MFHQLTLVDLTLFSGEYIVKYTEHYEKNESDENRLIAGFMQVNRSKGKVVPVLNKLSTMPSRRMWEWMHRSTYS
jgi:hypothetical protein